MLILRSISIKPNVQDILGTAAGESDPFRKKSYSDLLSMLAKLDKQAVHEAIDKAIDKAIGSDANMTGAWQNVFQRQLAERDQEHDRINLYNYVRDGHMTLRSAATIAGVTEDVFQAQMAEYFQTLERQSA